MYGIVKAMAPDRTNTAPGLYSVLRGNEIEFEGLSNVTPLFSTSFLPVKMTTTKKWTLYFCQTSQNRLMLFTWVQHSSFGLPSCSDNTSKSPTGQAYLDIFKISHRVSWMITGLNGFIKTLYNSASFTWPEKIHKNYPFLCRCLKQIVLKMQQWWRKMLKEHDSMKINLKKCSIVNTLVSVKVFDVKHWSTMLFFHWLPFAVDACKCWRLEKRAHTK